MPTTIAATRRRCAGAGGAYENVPARQGRLRLGFVSPDLGRHPVGYFLVRVLENLRLLPSPSGRGAGGEGSLLPSPSGSAPSGEGSLLPSPPGSAPWGEGSLLPSPSGSAPFG